MSPFRFCLALTALVIGTAAIAETPGEFSLEENIVKFRAPIDWVEMMHKGEGNPQFVAFQVKDPADQGTGETTQVTVETKLLDNSSDFQSQVNFSLEKSKQLPGYEQHTEGVDPTVLRYFALNGKTRYEYRETFYLATHILIRVRCARPMLAATTAEWTQSYEKGCAQVMQSIKPH